MSFAARIRETLPTIDVTSREQVIYRCSTCGEALDPAEDASIRFECTVCGAILGEQPQVCPQCTGYTFEAIEVQD